MKKTIVAMGVLVACSECGLYADDAIHIGNHVDNHGYYTCLHAGYKYLPGDNFTYSIWTKGASASDPGGLGMFMIEGAWGCGGAAFKFQRNGGTSWVSFVTFYGDGWAGSIDANQIYDSDGAVGIFDGGWHLLTGTQEVDPENTANATVKLYIDGALVDSVYGPKANVETEDAAGSYLCIGGYQTSNYSSGGYLADAGIWSRALSAREVLSLYSHRIDPQDENLLGYWPLNGTLADAVDNGAMAHDLALIQGSWDDCRFLGTGDFTLPTYAEWEANHGDAEPPAIRLDSVGNAADTSASATYQLLACGGDNTTVDLYSVVNLAGVEAAATNLIGAVSAGDTTTATVGALLPSRDYEVALLAVNADGGKAITRKLTVSTPASTTVYSAAAGSPYVVNVVNSAVTPTSATISGALDNSGVVSGVDVEVVLDDDTSAQATVEGGNWSVSFSNLASGREYGYHVVATAPGGTVDKLRGEPFVTYGPAVFTASQSASGGTNVTITVDISLPGLGTTTYTLMTGDSAESLAAVPGKSVSRTFEQGSGTFTLEIAFPWNREVYWSVASANVSGSDEYSYATAAAVFVCKDAYNIYTWNENVAEGDWNDPANWIPSRTPCPGYPDLGGGDGTYFVFTRPGTTKVHISGMVSSQSWRAMDMSFGRLELIGDPTRSDNQLAAAMLGGCGTGQTVVFDNITVPWWDLQPSYEGTLVYRGRNAYSTFGGLSGLKNANINRAFEIPFDGFANPPYWSINPLGGYVFEPGGNELPMNCNFCVSVSPDSPIFSRFGVTVTNKLVHGYITDGMREHIVCATPNYDTCSWDIRGD
ncbi:MAG: hypothetical protein ILO34_04390, partial [Kiritimatiellae bacterium]|nr:hypothetical protein [Kiritimatiellia bacterium]